jgi:2-amino-4-hydroxy-6-hydroxymethyldihydropteridine pyrophosphokinase
MIPQHKVAIGLGSNLGDRQATITKAIELLQENFGHLIACSNLMETQAWGFESNDKFLNGVVVFETSLEPKDMLVICQNIERKLGKNIQKPSYNSKGERIYFSRPIDVDILLIDQMIITTEDLVIPHPHIQERDFVLEPLKEVVPQWLHPVLKQRIKDIELQK